MFDQPHPAATASNPAERRWRVDLALLKREEFLAATLPAIEPGFEFDALLEFAYLDDFWTLPSVNPFGEPAKRREKVAKDVAKIGRYLAVGACRVATSSSSKNAIGGSRLRSCGTRRPPAAASASSAATRAPRLVAMLLDCSALASARKGVITSSRHRLTLDRVFSSQHSYARSRALGEAGVGDPASLGGFADYVLGRGDVGLLWLSSTIRSQTGCSTD
jgi:hypothetical protein